MSEELNLYIKDEPNPRCLTLLIRTKKALTKIKECLDKYTDEPNAFYSSVSDSECNHCLLIIKKGLSSLVVKNELLILCNEIADSNYE